MADPYHLSLVNQGGGDTELSLMVLPWIKVFILSQKRLNCQGILFLLQQFISERNTVNIRVVRYAWIIILPRLCITNKRQGMFSNLLHHDTEVFNLFPLQRPQQHASQTLLSSRL